MKSTSKLLSQNRFFLLTLGMIFLVTTGCSTDNKSEAYGQFEAIETTISTQASGELLSFRIQEGQELESGQQVGRVDSSKLVLQRDELQAQLESIKSKIADINAEVEVQKSELERAQKDLQRTRSLSKDGAATQKQLDDAEARVRTIRRKIDALQTQKQSIRAEIAATEAKIAQLEDQIDDTTIMNPVRGTVLTTFVEPHELVQKGQSLYRIANLDTLILRVYVSGGQLPEVKLGQDVEVLVDKNAEENQAMTGRVSWIAPEAEFTPQQIQTKEERVSQVYAVKVRVQNPNGTLKIGMPGEVNFTH